MDSLNKNENEENKSNMTLNKMKEIMLSDKKDILLLLDNKKQKKRGFIKSIKYKNFALEKKANLYLFQKECKSDDEENIKDQNDIYKIKGRKSISKLNIDEINNKNLENDENNDGSNNNNVEKNDNIDMVFENWKYEKILLDNNIIDYNRK